MQVNEARLRRQLEVLDKVRQLNLSRVPIQYVERLNQYKEDDLAEDTIRIILTDVPGNRLGEWSGNYQEFVLFCAMVERLGAS